MNERLTRQEYIKNPSDIKSDSLPSYTSIYWRLAAYENSGLSAEEVTELQRKFSTQNLCRAGLTSEIHLKRLEQICEAEREGRLIELTAKVGEKTHGLQNMYMDYNALLDQWAEKVFKEADKAMELSNDVEDFNYKKGYRRGYSDGLRMSTSILSRLEKLSKG